MPLDISIFSEQQVILFLASFTLVFFSLALTIHTAKNKKPYLAGGIIAICTTLLGALVLTPSLFITLSIVTIMTIVIGRYDERKNLSPKTQLLWQIGIAVIPILTGWTIVTVTNPVAPGVIMLSSVASAALTGMWLLFLINALNWIDGSDGLAGSVGFVALLSLAAVSLLPSIQDEATLNLSVIGAGALLAFLLMNWYPAKAYLGTVGSWWLGIYIGLVAILSGGKVVTTLLLLTFPIVDLFSVMITRAFNKQPIWQGDTNNHAHHRLKKAGFTEPQIAIGAILVTITLGILAISLQTQEKILVLVCLSSLMIITAIILNIYANRSKASAERK